MRVGERPKSTRQRYRPWSASWTPCITSTAGLALDLKCKRGSDEPDEPNGPHEPDEPSRASNLSGVETSDIKKNTHKSYKTHLSLEFSLYYNELRGLGGS